MPVDSVDQINKRTTNRSVCESCGSELSCGAKTGHCWCFEVKLSPETLIEINKRYSKCLCPACLINAERETLLAYKKPLNS